jgi:hypothetical protein
LEGDGEDECFKDKEGESGDCENEDGDVGQSDGGFTEGAFKA